MKRFKNILLVCDFDVKQHMAVERAVALARQNAARLTVFSVVRDLPADLRMAITGMLPNELLELVLSDRREKVAALAADMSREGVDASTRVLSGTPFLEIIRQVLRGGHDLVILAAEGKGGVRDRLFGSTSMHLMRKCPCPVWVVKPAKRTKYRRILAAVDTTLDFPDGEHESLNPLIVQLAASLARMDGSEFHLVQVWSVFAEGYLEVRGQVEGGAISKLRKDARRLYAGNLDRLLATVDLDGVKVHRHLPRSENIARAIVKLAQGKKIDLLVMGTVCRTGLAGFFIGNTAEKVLGTVNCSVLTVKPEGFVTPVRLENGAA